MIHVRHAIAAIESGLCKTVLVTHGESGKSMIGKPIVGIGPSQLEGQFQAPYGTYGPTTMFTIPALRYLKKYDIAVEKIANVALVPREGAAKQTPAPFRTPLPPQKRRDERRTCDGMREQQE